MNYVSVGPASKQGQNSQLHESECIWVFKVVCPAPRFPREFTKDVNVIEKIYVRMGRTRLESKRIEWGLGLSSGS